MLEQVLGEIHNWFRARDEMDGVRPGVYAIEGGRLALPFLQPGQYYRVCGSLFNDGLHKYGDQTDRGIKRRYINVTAEYLTQD